MSSLLNRILTAYQQKLPFVAYRKPNTQVLQAFFQQNDTLFFSEKFIESGFIFAPFNDANNAILIPNKHSHYLEETLNLNSDFQEDRDACFTVEDLEAKKLYLQLIKKTIKAIKDHEFQKVVISRKEEVELNDFDMIHTFKQLLNSYQNAFVSVWFHPKIGLWLGASPETLVRINNSQFSTMSLAGTQVFKNTEPIVWGNKELEEQQLVTNFIESQLKPLVTTMKTGERTTLKAGALMHLKTSIAGVFDDEKGDLKTCIKALHPTPAVCGLPRDTSKEFIQANEHYQRTFYTGFLGELNLPSKTNTIKSSLFVNLRCMEIQNNNAIIFIGGGITKDSNPSKEWDETVSKSLTMRKVL